MNSSKPKILITGIAGLIGSHMAEYLLKKEYEVYGVDNLSGGYIGNVPANVEWWRCDLGDTETVSAMFEEIKPDYVYHFAAYAAEGLSPFIRNFNYTNNLVNSVNVINECIKHGVKKIIFTSSMAVYGHGLPPFSENDRPSPVDPYGISKYAVEMDLAQAHDQFGLKYSVVRPHNVIGIRQNIWDKYRNVIGIWIRQALEGKNLTIFGDGEQQRAFSDIKYCLDPLHTLLYEQDQEIFNLGSDKEYSLNAVAEIVVNVAKEFDLDITVEHREARHEVKNAYCSHKKAKLLLSFEDDTNLQKSIKKMFEWARKQPERQVKTMTYEIDKGMYNYWK